MHSHHFRAFRPSCRIVSAFVLLALASSWHLPSSAQSPRSPADTDYPTKRRPGGGIDKLEQIIKQSQLTDEQKTKIEALFAAARQRLNAGGSTAGGNPMRANAKAYDDLRQGVESLLNETQKKQLRAEMAHGTNDPGAARGGPITRLRENLQQVGLTDKQNSKVQDLVLELRSKIPAIYDETGNDSHARGKRIHDLTEKYREKIIGLLTPEQKAKLDTLMSRQHGVSGFRAEKP